MPWDEHLGAHFAFPQAKSSDRKIPGQSLQYSRQGFVQMRVGAALAQMSEKTPQTVFSHLELKATELTID
jgi:hypothetical protein